MLFDVSIIRSTAKVEFVDLQVGGT